MSGEGKKIRPIGTAEFSLKTPVNSYNRQQQHSTQKAQLKDEVNV
jgi:hypothetical protein